MKYDIGLYLLENKSILKHKIWLALSDSPWLRDNVFKNILQDFVLGLIAWEVSVNLELHLEQVYDIIDHEFLTEILGEDIYG